MGLSNLLLEIMKKDNNESKISRKEQMFISIGFMGIGFLSFIASLLSDDFESDDRIIWIAMSIFMTLGGFGYFYYLFKSNKNIQQEQLNKLFYNLLKEKKGKITLIDFAIRANLEANIAREYLEKKAIEFSAQPEITEDGEVVYVFVKSIKY